VAGAIREVRTDADISQFSTDISQLSTDISQFSTDISQFFRASAARCYLATPAIPAVHPFNAGYFPLSCSGKPGVNGVFSRGAARATEHRRNIYSGFAVSLCTQVVVYISLALARQVQYHTPPRMNTPFTPGFPLQLRGK
jgi:hypothetical protein